MQTSVTVKVPATSANCGPGFDTFGISCALYNTVTLTLPDSGEVSLTVTGEGADMLTPGEHNLAVRAVRRVLAEVGRERPGVSLTMNNKIPLSRGLGSSSAAIAGSMVAANALMGNPLTRERIFELATELEGHPDNVAPALYGGITVSFVEKGKPYCLKLQPPPALRMVAAVPALAMSTKVARDVLPAEVPHRDAVFNLGRAALFVAAICNGELDFLRFALQDRLHQPYRGKFIPGMGEVFAAAVDAGALGGFLSGSGSTLMAFAQAGADLGQIGEAMRAALAKRGQDAVFYVLPFDLNGAQVA